MKLEFLDQKISQVVNEYPNRISIQYEDIQLTYRELGRESDRLANILNTLAVNDLPIIGIMLDKSPEMIISILGILKGSLIFLPFDVNHPQKRVSYIIKDTGLKYVITSIKYFKKYFSDYEDITFLIIDNEPKESVDRKEVIYIKDFQIKDKVHQINSYNPNCYLYYTSGSTGKPKGILGRHKSLSHFIEWEIKEFGVTPKWRISHLSPPSFDPALRDIFVPLCSGAICSIPQYSTILSPIRLVNWIIKNDINLIHIVPTLFRNILTGFLQNRQKYFGLKYILLAGELLRGNDIKEFIERYNERIQLINIYGPTETTLAKFFYRILATDTNRSIIPVGKAIKGAQVLVIDNEKKKCLTGNSGEIYIRTPFISSGYINNPELNMRTFLQNPFNNNPLDIIYKTGDFGRVLTCGNLELTGRIDQQVKIQGARVELGEIENSILSIKGILETVVIVKEIEGQRSLCAYIKSNDSVDLILFKRKLAGYLPKYMLPRYIMQVDDFQLNQNGKINQNALPEPAMESYGQVDKPNNKSESQLQRIFSDILSLDKNTVGINTGFFELGGHSLKIDLLISKIKSEFNVDLSIAEVFENQTIAQLSRAISKKPMVTKGKIVKAEQREYYPLSPAQRRIYFLQKSNIKSTFYNITLTIKLSGNLNVNWARECFKTLSQRHDSLRSCIKEIDNNPYLFFQEDTDVSFEYFESTDYEVTQDKIEQVIQPFELENAPLFRVVVIKEIDSDDCDNSFLLIFDIHHIISDGYSNEILINEFATLYNGNTLEKINYEFKDYICWYNNFLRTDKVNSQIHFWQSKFKGSWDKIKLPVVQNDIDLLKLQNNKIEYLIKNEEYGAIKGLVVRNSITVFNALLSVFNVTFSQLYSQNDLIFGTVVSGRNFGEFNEVTGPFINTIALRNKINLEESFCVTAQRIHNSNIECFQNSDFQFDSLVKKLSLHQNSLQNDLFDIVISYYRYNPNHFQLHDLKNKLYKQNNNYSKFPITIYLIEDNESIRVVFEYSLRYFKNEAIATIVDSFKHILFQVLKRPEIKIHEIDLLDKKKKKILRNFNNNQKKTSNLTVFQSFINQAEKTPNKIAVVSNDHQITYGMLSQRANAVGINLLKKNALEGEIIGIAMESSIEFIISVFGALSIRGVFLPIDPENPVRRVKYMLEDSAVRVLIYNKANRKSNTLVKEINSGIIEKEDLNYPIKDVINIQDILKNDRSSTISHYSTRYNNQEKDSSIYVIYTSGSTGVPKGVLVGNLALANLCSWHNDNFSVTLRDKASKYAGIGFDATVWEIFPYLIKGASICMIDNSIRFDLASLNKYFEKENVTIAFLPTAIFENFQNFKNKSLRILLTGGDKLNIYRKSNYHVFNNYGPTENTVVTTSYKIETPLDNIPIGSPISNNNVYILDSKSHKIKPKHFEGEIFIGGKSLASGYINSPELNHEYFIKNPFVTEEKLYRTGDLGIWTDSGNILFTKRNDDQIKLRGYRIEIGEIEKAISKHPQVRNCAVVLKTISNVKYLCAYYSSAIDLEEELIRHLKEHIPDYMIPGQFFRLNDVPLTINGKIDKKELLNRGDVINTAVDTRPKERTEKILIEKIGKVVGIQDVDLNCDFFKIGGDSIKAIQLIAHLRDAGYELDINDVFNSPVLYDLSKRIKLLEETDSLENIYEGNIPFTPIQKWYMEQFENNAFDNFNQSVLLNYNGRLDYSMLKRIFNEIQTHHHTLRISLKLENGNLVQVYNTEDLEVDISMFNFHGKPMAEELIKVECSRIADSIDLFKPPLMKVGLFRLDDGDKLFVAIHHFIIDAISWRIIFENLQTLFNQYTNQLKQTNLLGKSHSYKYWADKLAALSTSRQVLEELDYWKEVQQLCMENRFSRDFDHIENEYKYCKHKSFELSVEKTRLLLTKANDPFNTDAKGLLITALGLTFCKVFNLKRIPIAIESHGREMVFNKLDLSSTIGWFTNVFPFVFDYNNSDDIQNQIIETKEKYRSTSFNGFYFNVLKYITPKHYLENVDFSGSPQICFNYLGQFDSDFQDKFFTVSNETIDSNINVRMKRLYDFEISGLVIGNQLKITLRYNARQYALDTIQEIIQIFKDEVINIVDKCANSNKKVITPRDFSNVELSVEELNSLFD